MKIYNRKNFKDKKVINAQKQKALSFFCFLFLGIGNFLGDVSIIFYYKIFMRDPNANKNNYLNITKNLNKIF